MDEITIKVDENTKYYFVGVTSSLYPKVVPSYYAYKAAKWESTEAIRKEESEILGSMHRGWKPEISDIQEVSAEKYYEMCNADIMTAVNFVEMQILSLQAKPLFSRMTSLTSFLNRIRHSR